MKLKNVLTGQGTETVYKADDKLDDIILEKKECTYSYFADPLFVFMDEEYNQYEIEKDDLGDSANYIEDGMQDVCEVTFYNGRPISVEMPTIIVREVAYTEPAVRGDTSGKVMKTARLTNGAELSVASYIEIGEKIEIDTRTGEFRKRA
jgi:elongation factor P